MNVNVTVQIPGGADCRYAETGKPCIFARYARRMGGYNCSIHHHILKGQQQPRKCQQCILYCKKIKEG